MGPASIIPGCAPCVGGTVAAMMLRQCVDAQSCRYGGCSTCFCSACIVLGERPCQWDIAEPKLKSWQHVDGRLPVLTQGCIACPLAGEACLGQCLYVAGVPGTGKTAMVRQVMRGLRARADAGQLPAFRFVEINALRLPTPQHAYVQLYRVRARMAPDLAACRRWHSCPRRLCLHVNGGVHSICMHGSNCIVKSFTLLSRLCSRL